MTRSKEYLLYNAVLSWLANYGSMGEELTPQYQQLETELKKNYEQSLNPQTQKRGRPAKRQRTKKATSNPSSTEKSETVNQEA
tara:strand:+ start:110 stop:358 length:249 start_codon:yes stop_codon:yes gene_type:complete